MDSNIAITWENASNASFYNMLGFEGLSKTSEIAGVDTFADLKLIYAGIKQAKYLLDVGSAYGRVESFLLKNGFEGQIDAIEQSHSLYEKLLETHGAEVNCLHGDIMKYTPKVQYDAILCMFSVITDFPHNEQFLFIQKLKSILSNKDDACIILESFPQGKTPLNCTTLDQKNYQASYNGEILHGYLPSSEEMSTYAARLLMKLDVIPYKTTTNRDRVLYIFRNANAATKKSS